MIIFSLDSVHLTPVSASMLPNRALFFWRSRKSTNCKQTLALTTSKTYDKKRRQEVRYVDIMHYPSFIDGTHGTQEQIHERCMMTQNLKQQGHKKRQHFKGSKYKLVPQRNDHSCRATYLNMLWLLKSVLQLRVYAARLIKQLEEEKNRNSVSGSNLHIIRIYNGFSLMIR